MSSAGFRGERLTEGDRNSTQRAAPHTELEMQTALNHIGGRDLPQIRGSLKSQLESNNIMRLKGNFLLVSQPAHFPPSLSPLVLSCDLLTRSIWPIAETERDISSKCQCTKDGDEYESTIHIRSPLLVWLPRNSCFRKGGLQEEITAADSCCTLTPESFTWIRKCSWLFPNAGLKFKTVWSDESMKRQKTNLQQESSNHKNVLFKQKKTKKKRTDAAC